MLASLLAASLIGSVNGAPAIVPLPQHMQVLGSPITLAPNSTLSADPELADYARLWREWARPATGFSFPPAAPGAEATIQLKLSEDPTLGEEGYALNVTDKGVELWAQRPSGIFYGLQTLRQLLPTSIYRSTKQEANWTLPQVQIHDYPRFPWRGLMLDVARHYQPVEDVKKFIDLLALHKMNVFHWHLTDDQGWRVEIKKYPRLTEVGSWRRETVIGRNSGKYDGIPHGGYYTQEDLKEIVAYAAERHITIVPEIDMPGHMVAAISAYPELGDGKPAEVMMMWGVSPRVLNTKPETVQFCKDVLDEVMAIFPSKFIHIGGDECPKDQWKNDPAEQQRMKERGLKDEHELQSWFIRQMDAHLQSKGRRLIGWDEILEGGLAEGAAVMSWRGTSGGVEAAKLGQDVVMSPTSHMYLDYYQSRDASEPLAIGGYLPLQQVYAFNPIVPGLPVEAEKHIMGVQGNLWTEYMKDFKHVEYMAYPRGAAVAEVGWSAQASRSYPDFLVRLSTHLERLTAWDVNFRTPTPTDVPVSTWNADQMSTEWVERAWDLSKGITQNGNFRVKFAYTHGSHRLDIQWAELWVNDVRAGRDEHLGTTGGRDEKNDYRFDGVIVPAGAKVILKASVRSDGGTDSFGHIYVDKL